MQKVNDIVITTLRQRRSGWKSPVPCRRWWICITRVKSCERWRSAIAQITNNISNHIRKAFIGDQPGAFPCRRWSIANWKINSQLEMFFDNRFVLKFRKLFINNTNSATRKVTETVFYLLIKLIRFWHSNIYKIFLFLRNIQSLNKTSRLLNYKPCGTKVHLPAILVKF